MRPQLTDQEVEAFRGRLVRAAAKLFATHGVGGVTMRQIAKSLGYSQPPPTDTSQTRKRS